MTACSSCLIIEPVNNRMGGGMEQNLMTIRDVAEYLRLAEQTIQRYVMKREIPFHKVNKVIRFRFAEIEKWINEGGGACPASGNENLEGDLFANAETTEAGEITETVAVENEAEGERE
jgi:excisionase family DNA binding protein